MNVIDWLNATSDYMVTDRSDIYDKAGALNDLSTAMEGLRDFGAPMATVSFTSYLLTRLYSGDLEEFILSRKVATLALFPEEESLLMCSHLESVDLPNITDLGFDEDIRLDGDDDL